MASLFLYLNYEMNEELQIIPPPPDASETVHFIPSHLTKGLVAAGLSLGASVVAMGFGVYALHELKQTTAEEVLALLGKY